MSSPNIVERFLRGEELPVAADQIENVLAMLWQAVPAERNITRASEINLLAQMSSPALIDRTAAIVREFSKRHPCRALLLVLNPGSEQEELTSSVTPLFDSQDAGQKITGGEQILIIASGQRARQASALASPLVLPDLPVAYWFVQGIPAEAPLLESVLEKDPRVIFDSLTVEDLGITLARANALFEKNRYAGDLNWQRLAPWLTQLEEIFAKPEAASLTAGIASLSFVIGGEILDENQIGQPALLMSWLAQRFGWELVETLDYVKGAFRSVWEKERREIVVEIKNTNAAMKELCALEFVARSAQEQSTLTITRVENGARFSLQTVLSRDGQNSLQQQTPTHAPPALAELLLREFEREAIDESYKKTLTLATKLI